MAAGRREEVAGGEQARPDILARVEGSLPGDIHVVVRAGERSPVMPDSVRAAISRWPNSVTWSASGISVGR